LKRKNSRLIRQVYVNLSCRPLKYFICGQLSVEFTLQRPIQIADGCVNIGIRIPQAGRQAKEYGVIDSVISNRDLKAVS